MRKMFPQDMFNAAYLGLAKQGFRRSGSYIVEDHFSCLYSGPDGTHCAIGWCLSADELEEIEEGTGADDVMDKLEISGDRTFANYLQKAHDTGLSPATMKDHLRTLAIEYDLTIPTTEPHNA